MAGRRRMVRDGGTGRAPHRPWREPPDRGGASREPPLARGHPEASGRRSRELDGNGIAGPRRRPTRRRWPGWLSGAVTDRRRSRLPAAVAAFLPPHAVQDWGPPLPVLRRLDLRAARAIDVERDALRARRGFRSGWPRSRRPWQPGRPGRHGGAGWTAKPPTRRSARLAEPWLPDQPASGQKMSLSVASRRAARGSSRR